MSVGSVIIGLVGWWVSSQLVGGSVSKWSAVGWSVVGGFNKSHTLHGLQLKQGFHKDILGLLLFLIYINDLSDDSVFNAKLFANHTWLFSVVENMTRSANELNNDLSKISSWPFQWKMNLNPDSTKQAQKVIFSRKLQNTNHPCLSFNHDTVSLTDSQKHLGIVLDSRLDFNKHLEII